MAHQKSDSAAVGVASKTGVVAPKAVVPDVPKGPHLDKAGDKIFIPGMGWMTTSRFVDVYENHPDLLPKDLDLVATHQILERLKGNG